MTPPRFDLSGLAMSATVLHDSAGLIRVTAPTEYGAKSAVLGREAQRAAGWWLLAAAGDQPPPADPDKVRVAVDTARAALRQRLTDGQLDDGLTAAAWFESHLDDIARAAGGLS